MNQNAGGIGFLGLLGLIFIGLKLARIGVVADWSWWWVLAPLWGPVAAAAIILGVALAWVAARFCWLRIRKWRGDAKNPD